MQTPPSVKSLADAYSAIQVESTPEPTFEAIEDVLQNEAAEVEAALQEATSAAPRPKKVRNPHKFGTANFYSHEANHSTALAKHYSSLTQNKKTRAAHNRAANAHARAAEQHDDAATAHDDQHGGRGPGRPAFLKHQKMAAYHWKQVDKHEDRASTL